MFFLCFGRMTWKIPPIWSEGPLWYQPTSWINHDQKIISTRFHQHSPWYHHIKSADIISTHWHPIGLWGDLWWPGRNGVPVPCPVGPAASESAVGAWRRPKIGNLWRFCKFGSEKTCVHHVFFHRFFELFFYLVLITGFKNPERRKTHITFPAEKKIALISDVSWLRLMSWGYC